MKSFQPHRRVKSAPVTTKSKTSPRNQKLSASSKRSIGTKIGPNAHNKTVNATQTKRSPFLHHLRLNSTAQGGDEVQSTTQFVPRLVTKVVQNKLLPEGVGTSVRRSIGRDPRYFSPFALLDNFLLDEYSMDRELGFHPHPHRGMATFTYILPTPGNGSIRHEDHRGNAGIIGPGDVQYMAAGKGIVHSETPVDSTAIQGMQLWVNLPKSAKMDEPEYQEYRSEELPVVERDGVFAKVLMGTALGANAKIKTKTPVHYIHYRLQPGIVLDHPFPSHWNSFAYILQGGGRFGDRDVADKHTVFFAPGHDAEESFAEAKARVDTDHEIPSNRGVRIVAGPNGIDFILVAGESLDPSEGVVQHGPMVMNTRQEIQEAFEDFRTNRNGFEGAQQFIQNWVYPKPEHY